MIVLGLGFGDEGKGLTTSYLVAKAIKETGDLPTVVRFNGGHQAGHTVVHKGIRHVFSHFGSGTLQGANTFWSRHCTVSPIAFMNELKVLTEEGYEKPIDFYVDPDCPVTTPYEVEYNGIHPSYERHGTVGVGFGPTLEREENHYHLRVRDLEHPEVFKAKMKLIEEYYLRKRLPRLNLELESFYSKCQDFLENADIMQWPYYLSHNPSGEIIMEGAQGIMLDQEYGFFPHVTRSYTTSRNTVGMGVEQRKLFVTRTYMTRHGKGPMPGNELNHHLPSFVEVKDPTNVRGEFQGELRTGFLHIDLMVYALKCATRPGTRSGNALMITCVDQVIGEDRVPVIFSGSTDIFVQKPLQVAEALEERAEVKFSKVYVSHGPSHTDVTQIR